MATDRAVVHLANAVGDLTAAVVALRDRASYDPSKVGLLGLYSLGVEHELNSRLERALEGVQRAISELGRGEDAPVERR